MSPESFACPRCGAIDMARHVSAIVWDGHSRIAMSGAYGGLVGFTPTFGVSSHNGRVTTDLAVALSAPPPPPSRGAWFGWIAALIATAACPAGLAFFAAATPNSDGRAAATGFAIIAAPFIAVIALLIVLLTRRLRADRRWRRAMPDMHTVWEAAFYCARCTVAYFPHTELPPSLPTTVQPANFRDVVWLAGMIHSARCHTSRTELPASSAAPEPTTSG